MLTIYHSNQLTLLKTLMAELIKRDPLTNPLESEMILVQSQGMAQWLQMELAQELGIAANMQFSLPASFIWHLYSAVIPDLPPESAFSKSAMTWKLMELLSIFSSDERFRAIQTYLSGGNTLKKHYQFSAMIADLYDQYLVYRPEWIAAWEHNRTVDGLNAHQNWQSALWQALVAHTDQLGESHWHRANLHQHILTAFEQGNVNQARLPKRLFICGIASFPPTQMQILQALSQYIPVHFMFLNPCRWYWGEIKDHKSAPKIMPSAIASLSPASSSSQSERSWLKLDAALIDDAPQSNPLLASWGKLGRDHLYLLQEIEPKNDIDAFVDYDGDTLLQMLQQDIYELFDRAAPYQTGSLTARNEDKKVLSRQDNSLQLHVCHSAQREVEVLYDQLLAMLDADPSLAPRDIIVMVADIDHYAPYIHAVFGNPPASRYLPFSISDRTMEHLDPIIRTFSALLALPQSRCTAEHILGFLEVPAVAEKWGIDEAGFTLLQHWIHESGIRWGLDDTTALDFDLPASTQNTWQFGITRMLLGYVMNSDRGLWHGYLSYDETSGLVAETAGKLAAFVAQLQQWRQCLAEPKLLSEWQAICQTLLDTFFITNNDTDALLAYIENTWQQVIRVGQKSSFSLPISVEIISDMLQKEFSQSHISQRFLAGKINFCTLMPMRTIPFDVVCLLGMNDGVYPRTHLPISFDLMADNMRRGDRSRRDDDRYLFLEALMSAQKRLYISYIGYAIQDNSVRYPSVLVSELWDYVTQSFRLEALDKSTQPAPLQAESSAGQQAIEQEESAAQLRAYLTIEHPRMPFDPENFLPDTPTQSYASEWLPAALRSHPAAANALPNAVTLVEMNIDALQRFYRHSIRAFFEQRLHVYFAEAEQVIPDDEPFSITGLQRYQLDQTLLTHCLDAQCDDQTLNKLMASGALPQGAFGRIILQQRYQEMRELADTIAPWRQESTSLEVDVTLNGMRVVGWLKQIQPNGLLRWRAGELSIVDGMRLWIDHVILAALGHSQTSRMLGRKKSLWIFSPLSTEQAQVYLADLIAGYQSGMNSPMLLPLKSAWKWLQSAGKITNGHWQLEDEKSEEAERQMLSVWAGGWQLSGEGQDDYYQRVTPNLSDDQLAEITANAQRFLLPILLHREEE